ncbi:uncharacterized protein LOC132197916 isoform X1 [Neocloeon triangulifer]|uniref:uncharacterized protein LOC132197916 isoform X1 n=1 Tax=Neocloeon triangulifer TaxID=2078957 RepID=UPI00286FAA80|nr:uncharacterized protein LOC132197916 isoform X1 [Neocloeon triangulifer]
MANTRSKCFLLFFSTAIIVAVIWNRRTKSDNHDYEHLIQYQLHGDDMVLPRHKRQAAGSSLNDIYSAFGRVDNCCNVPNLLISDALSLCQPKINKKQQKQQRPVQKNAGWLGNVRNLFYPQTTVVKAAPKRKGRSAEKFNLDAICYTDCLFNSFGFMNGTNLKLDVIEKHFTDKVSYAGSWKDVVLNALYACEEPASCATPETIYQNNRFCNVKPIILMHCMQKQMILNCPGAVGSPACKNGIQQLRGTNVISLENCFKKFKRGECFIWWRNMDSLFKFIQRCSNESAETHNCALLRRLVLQLQFSVWTANKQGVQLHCILGQLFQRLKRSGKIRRYGRSGNCNHQRKRFEHCVSWLRPWLADKPQN